MGNLELRIFNAITDAVGPDGVNYPLTHAVREAIAKTVLEELSEELGSEQSSGTPVDTSGMTEGYCPNCEENTMRGSLFYMLPEDGPRTVGAWSICEQCGYSPHGHLTDPHSRA